MSYADLRKVKKGQQLWYVDFDGVQPMRCTVVEPHAYTYECTIEWRKKHRKVESGCLFLSKRGALIARLKRNKEKIEENQRLAEKCYRDMTRLEERAHKAELEWQAAAARLKKIQTRLDALE
jgi:hypothetical protein